MPHQAQFPYGAFSADGPALPRQFPGKGVGGGVSVKGPGPASPPRLRPRAAEDATPPPHLHTPPCHGRWTGGPLVPTQRPTKECAPSSTHGSKSVLKDHVEGHVSPPPPPAHVLRHFPIDKPSGHRPPPPPRPTHTQRPKYRGRSEWWGAWWGAQDHVPWGPSVPPPPRPQHPLKRCHPPPRQRGAQQHMALGNVSTPTRSASHGGGGGDLQVSQLRLGNFEFQIGCEISRTRAADTVDCGGEGLLAAHALRVDKPHFVLFIGVPPSLGGASCSQKVYRLFTYPPLLAVDPFPTPCPLQGVTVALAGGGGRIPPSKSKHTSGPETNLTLITGRVWQMGLPCICGWHLWPSFTEPYTPQHFWECPRDFPQRNLPPRI